MVAQHRSIASDRLPLLLCVQPLIDRAIVHQGIGIFRTQLVAQLARELFAEREIGRCQIIVCIHPAAIGRVLDSGGLIVTHPLQVIPRGGFTQVVTDHLHHRSLLIQFVHIVGGGRQRVVVLPLHILSQASGSLLALS